LNPTENTTRDFVTMTDKSFTEAEIEAGYAELAADLKREAEERQAIDAALRKSSRRISPRNNAGLDELGNPIPGMWNVVLSTGAPYERSYDRSVGLLNSLAAAEEYCDAFDKASNIASGKTINQYESTHCRIEFIPFGEFKPVFHALYTVETERHDDNSNERIITGVTAEIISEKNLLKMINNGNDPRLAAVWTDKSLAVALNNETETSAQEIVSSEIFGPVKVIAGEYEDGTPFSYTEGIENFLTFDPANVVLKNQAKE
jgi:hypothetical protein